MISVLPLIGAIWGGGTVALLILFLAMYGSYRNDHPYGYQKLIDAYWGNTLRRWALSIIWPMWFLTVLIPYTIKVYRKELIKAKKDLTVMSYLTVFL